MYTLYTAPSPHGHRVSIMLEEMGTPYRIRVLDLAAGDQIRPDFLVVSPLGKIPALTEEDGGRQYHLFGSAAILQYLAERHGRLMPQSRAERAQALNWLSLATTDLGPNGVSIHHFSVRHPLPEAIERFRLENQRCHRALDLRLNHSPYLAGEEYSIADIATFPFIAVVRATYPEVLAPYGDLRRWLDLIAARPAVQRGLAIP